MKKDHNIVKINQEEAFKFSAGLAKMMKQREADLEKLRKPRGRVRKFLDKFLNLFSRKTKPFAQNTPFENLHIETDIPEGSKFPPCKNCGENHGMGIKDMKTGIIAPIEYCYSCFEKKFFHHV